MKLISWNVNGLRACLGKGFMDFFNKENADIFCIQETKMHKEQAEVISDGYEQFWFSAEKKGYSGTLPKVSFAASVIFSLVNTSPIVSASTFTNSSMQQVTAKATMRKNTT